MVGGSLARLRGRAGLLAPVLVTALLAVACGVQSAAPRSPKRTQAASPAPGTMLDGRHLPKPISSLFSAGSVVEYLAVGKDGYPMLVAVDPATAKVRWTRHSLLSAQPAGVALFVDGVNRNAAIISFRSDGEDGWAVQSLSPSGRVRWERPIEDPQSSPMACGGRICVQTKERVISFDADTSTRQWGATLPPPRRSGGTGSPIDTTTQPVDSDRGATLGVTVHVDGTKPATAVVLAPGSANGKGWSQPFSAIFGGDQLTTHNGYIGGRYGRTWVLWLAHLNAEPEGVKPTFPLVVENGSTAGFSAATGAPRWHRGGDEVCNPFADAAVLVLCRPTLTYPSAKAKGRRVVTSLDVADPATGRTTFRVRVDHPLDLFDTSARLLRLDGDRWLLRDGSRTSVVDLARKTRTPGSRATVGWCSENAPDAEVKDPWGKVGTYRHADDLQPCVLGKHQPAVARLVKPIVDGSLKAPGSSSVATVGHWVVWVDHDRLSGVLTR